MKALHLPVETALNEILGTNSNEPAAMKKEVAEVIFSDVFKCNLIGLKVNAASTLKTKS